MSKTDFAAILADPQAFKAKCEDLSLTGMVDLYNDIAIKLGFGSVRKFSDRKAGMRRLDAVIGDFVEAQTPEEVTGESIATEAAEQKAREEKVLEHSVKVRQFSEEQAKVEAAAKRPTHAAVLDDKPTKRRVAERKTPTKPEGKGRAAKFENCYLWPSAKVMASGNPRRAGSFGFNSLQLILDHPGISLRSFIAQGGRTVDLNWDVNHGNATCTSTSGAPEHLQGTLAASQEPMELAADHPVEQAA